MIRTDVRRHPAERGLKPFTCDEDVTTLAYPLRTHERARARSLPSIRLRPRHASSAKLHNGDRLPNVSAPGEICHSAASLLFLQALLGHPSGLTLIT